MKILFRVMITLLCFGILLFCIYGFLATFEPLPESIQLTWRIIYSVIGTLCVAGVVGVNYLWKNRTKH